MKYGTWLLCILLALPVSAAAQPSGVPIERILDTTRDFDPFEKAVTAEKYFPDEIERRTRRAMVDSLLRRTGQLPAHARFLKEADEERAARDAEPTGLTGLVKGLLPGDSADQEEEKALATTFPGAARNLEQAEELLAENDVGRWSGFLNRLLGAMDLFRLASGSYVAAAFETAYVEVQRTRTPHMPEAERKALVLYQRFLDRFPDHPRSAEVAETATALQTKKRDTWVHRQLEQADKALDDGRVEEAELHARLAAMADPEAEGVVERFLEIDAARETERENRVELLSVAEGDNLSGATPEQRNDIRALLYALVRRDPAETEKQASVMAERYADETLGTLAKDSRAVALELEGRHEDAKQMLTEIARSAPSSRERERADTLLNNPEYNMLRVLDRARSGHRMDQVRFVLFGENFLEKNALIGAAPVISQGVAGAATLGTANVLMVTSNLLELLSGNPVSNQTVIDTAAGYVRARPGSEKSGDVYQVLGEAYESKGHPHKALHYYRLSGNVPAEEIQELEERAGQSLLTAAERTGKKARQRTLYATILQYYPNTPAGEEARGKLAELAAPESRGLKLSKQFLTENPQLYGVRGLGLKATLFDGNVHNMELADAGLNILGRNTVLLHYDTPQGTRTLTRSVARERIDNLVVLLRDRHYEFAKLGAASDLGGAENFRSRLMRFEVPDRHRDSDDLAFIRRTGRGADPESPVLDHELLSKKETDPHGLPVVQGSVTTSGISMRTDAPKSFLADELVIGNDAVSPYAGVRTPVPFVTEYIPMDFLFRARSGLPSLTPQIRKPKTLVDDEHLYR